MTMDAKRLARSVDRGVLRNPWVSRAGSIVFLGNTIRALVQAARGADVLTVLTFVLFAVGVVLMAAPPIRRRMKRRAERQRPSEAPDQLASEFSAWVRAKHAALPDWPGGGPRGPLHTDSPAYQTYDQTRRDVDREARVEYHQRFRERVVARLGEGHEQASDPRTVEDFKALEQRLRGGPIDATPPTSAESNPPLARGDSLGPEASPAPSRSPALAERLSRLYRDGERLRDEVRVDLRSRETFEESRDEGQTERHRSVRGWSETVRTALYRDEGRAFIQQWKAAGSILDPHPTLGLIEPTLSYGELIRSMNSKLVCLKEIIKALGDSTPELERPAAEPESPAERLNEALRRGMALRTTLLLEDQGHWEGDELVLPNPLPFSEDPVYIWARETYDLLREHFPAYADDFYGGDPSLGSEHFPLFYVTEVKDGRREAYLESRIDALKRITRDVIR